MLQLIILMSFFGSVVHGAADDKKADSLNPKQHLPVTVSQEEAVLLSKRRKGQDPSNPNRPEVLAQRLVQEQLKKAKEEEELVAKQKAELATQKAIANFGSVVHGAVDDKRADSLNPKLLLPVKFSRKEAAFLFKFRKGQDSFNPNRPEVLAQKWMQEQLKKAEEEKELVAKQKAELATQKALAEAVAVAAPPVDARKFTVMRSRSANQRQLGLTRELGAQEREEQEAAKVLAQERFEKSDKHKRMQALNRKLEEKKRSRSVNQRLQGVFDLERAQSEQRLRQNKSDEAAIEKIEDFLNKVEMFSNFHLAKEILDSDRNRYQELKKKNELFPFKMTNAEKQYIYWYEKLLRSYDGVVWYKKYGPLQRFLDEPYDQTDKKNVIDRFEKEYLEISERKSRDSKSVSEDEKLFLNLYEDVKNRKPESEDHTNYGVYSWLFP